MSDKKIQQEQTSQIEIKRKILNDHVSKRTARPHAAIIESTLIQTSIDPGAKQSITKEIVRNASLE